MGLEARTDPGPLGLARSLCSFSSGSKRKDTNLKKEVRITKLVLSVCQSSKSLKGKESTLSQQPSQPRAKPPSFSSSQGSKTKKGKALRRSLKQKQPEVRTAPVATPCDTCICTGAPVLLAIVKPQSYFTPSKVTSLNTPGSPDSCTHMGGGSGCFSQHQSVFARSLNLPKKMPPLSPAQWLT